jgi:hypothetical protein
MSAILVYGPSGYGKSTAITNLDPKETFVISSDDKELPFKGWRSKYKCERFPDGKIDIQKSNYYEGNDPRTIIKLQQRIIAERPDIKNIVYDTLTHMMIYRFMTDPNVDWDFYKVLAREIYGIIDTGKKDKTRNHIFIAHNETSYDAAGRKVDKVRTLGKLLDEKVELASMFTVVLVPEVDRTNEQEPVYNFITQSNGATSAKSPMGMFSYKIPNDYKYVLDKIHEYETNV